MERANKNQEDAARHENRESAWQCIDDGNVKEYSPLITPEELRCELPLSERQRDAVTRSRKDIAAALAGRDKRIVLICGPCSIHDKEAAMEYADRLKGLSGEVDDSFILVMRSYFEKPRTGMAWRGYINQPDLDGNWQRSKGLRLARNLLLYNAEIGLPSATEFLDPLIPQYISDLVSWGCIGARTSESQTHRAMVSALPMPVGFKNNMAGSVQAAIEGIRVAGHEQVLTGIQPNGSIADVTGKGNKDTHVVLRGGVGLDGTQNPNYDSRHVAEALAMLKASGLRERLMVDASHANSMKDHTRQPAVFTNVVQQIADGNAGIFGIMLESNIGEGRQDLKGGRGGLEYGVSITDACIGWRTTRELVLKARETLQAKKR